MWQRTNYSRKGKVIRGKERKEAIKEIAPFRYLIVCEGEKTEPLYFQGIKKLINEKYGDKIVVNEIKAERITLEGTGRNTEDLVRYSIEKRKSAKIPYGNVWCVFDKDSFTEEQFNNSIMKAENNNIKVAWSNEAIELWFLLHFEFLNTGIGREQYIVKLDEYFEFYSISNGKYEKNLENIYHILCEFGDLEKAIKHAKILEKNDDKSITPSQRKPATKVYELVEELFDYLQG